MSPATVQPTDLPRIRDDLITWAANPIAAEFRRFDMDEGRLPVGNPAASVAADAGRLATADLYWIAEDLVDLVVAAAASLPPFTLASDDVPSLHGFAYFAEPVVDVEIEGNPVHIAAVGWSVIGGRVQVTTYLRREDMPVDEERLRGLGLPPVAGFGTWQAPVVSDDSADRIRMDEPGGTMLAAVKTLWLLMRQPLTETTPARFDRAARRRFAREGKEPPPVRVLNLRRPPGVASGTSSREWRHRWMVRGHWRQQPYGPGRERTRPVWISPFIKGPDGAPLIGGEKVYHVDGP